MDHVKYRTSQSELGFLKWHRFQLIDKLINRLQLALVLRSEIAASRGIGDLLQCLLSLLGFDLDIPIFSSLKRSASTQRAKIALDKAKTQLFETEERVRLDWQRARSDFQFAIEEYQTKKNNLDLAERIEQKNQIKYQEGLASSFELRQAQTQLYTAQQEYLQSMVDVINRKTALENILNQ